MIRFDPMTQAEFEAYLAQAVQEYAAEHTRSGRWKPEEALEKSRAEHARQLPEGLATPDHFLRSIVAVDSGQPVGLIWFWHNRQRQRVTLYDILVDEPFRRRGYGTQAMRLLEEESRKLGAEAIELHVFGHNQAAQALYEKLDYETTNIIMAKNLARS
jgi:ribosomal protein S18 acetylase RimI-like enzyme